MGLVLLYFTSTTKNVARKFQITLKLHFLNQQDKKKYNLHNSVIIKCCDQKRFIFKYAHITAGETYGASSAKKCFLKSSECINS